MKKTLWVVFGVAVTTIGVFIWTLYVLSSSVSPYQKRESEAVSLVKSEQIMSTVHKFYWQRSNESVYGLQGKSLNNQAIYAIIEIERKIAHLYHDNELLSEAQAIEVLNQMESQPRVLDIVLGWDNQQPVWVITYQTATSQLNYLTISAFNGRIIRHIKSI